MLTGAPFSPKVASSPPKPAPTITTRWSAAVVMREAPGFRVSPCIQYVCIGITEPRAFFGSADSERLSHGGIFGAGPKNILFPAESFRSRRTSLQQDAMILHRANR